MTPHRTYATVDGTTVQFRPATSLSGPRIARPKRPGGFRLALARCSRLDVGVGRSCQQPGFRNSSRNTFLFFFGSLPLAYHLACTMQAPPGHRNTGLVKVPRLLGRKAHRPIPACSTRTVHPRPMMGPLPVRVSRVPACCLKAGPRPAGARKTTRLGAPPARPGTAGVAGVGTGADPRRPGVPARRDGRGARSCREGQTRGYHGNAYFLFSLPCCAIHR